MGQVEIIGWLYQFYISDKKDEVIGEVVKSDDIPAATQLFSPNWIVKYMTQNSIGRLWLMANPQSGLQTQMAYYVAPAEQTPEVQAQLDALIQSRMAEDGGSLGRKGGQSAEDAIRSYISGSFFKDHLQTYKKRPIYWLFSSGKQKAFECLIYLHRYNDGTLARMRNEYVIPLVGKFGGRADLLQNLITAASTTSERSKLQKELDSLKKKQLELNQFDE